MKIYDSWTFTKAIRKPIKDMMDRVVGNKVATAPEYFSQYNNASDQKATMHGPTITALLRLIEILDESAFGGVGYQSGTNGEVLYTCLEYVVNRDRHAAVYLINEGTVKAGRMQNGTMAALDALRSGKNDGWSLIALFAYSSYIKDGIVYNQEFAENFEILRQQKKDQWKDEQAAIKAAFICCDNLYRRIEQPQSAGSARIPLADNFLSSKAVPLLSPLNLDGRYAPNNITAGSVSLLGVCTAQNASQPTISLAEFKKNYNWQKKVVAADKIRIPEFQDNVEVPEEVLQVCTAVQQTDMRVFLFQGESGTGKSTAAKLIASGLGLPYFEFNCSSGTDELDVVCSMVPNTKSETEKPSLPQVSFEDFMIDPASALAAVTGQYDGKITEDDALLEMMNQAHKLGQEHMQKQKDVMLVESEIIEACKRPAVIEIQEPRAISKAGILVRLNGLLDDGATITLMSGEKVKRHPDTVIIYTSNVGYKSNHDLDQSVLSRIDMVFNLKPLSIDKMVAWALRRSKCKDQQILRGMAIIIRKIQQYCRNSGIDDGICSFREYLNWIQLYSIGVNMKKAADLTVIGKCSQSDDEMEDVKLACIEPFISSDGRINATEDIKCA